MNPSAASTQAGIWAILELDLPGLGTVNAGVLLVDPSTGRLLVRLRRDWDYILPPELLDEAEVLSFLESDLQAKAGEMGALRLLDTLADTLSNTLRITDPQQILVENFDRALARLYRQSVISTVQAFVTHLPRYSLSVAAGKFLENQDITEESWEEVPSGLHLDDRMFLAHIAGRSMEPRIPDGSLCIFRSGVTGSRQGRLVLVEAFGRGDNDRYTVKRYVSEKRPDGSGGWHHERIRLEPLNPEFEAWDLDPEEDRYRILAEFIAVAE